jgi:signal transduction histidine kinase
MLAPHAEDHQLDLVLDYPPRLPRHFVGDAGRIRQVLTNLVGNAIKFTPGGQVCIAVECAGPDARIAELSVSVQDTGVGIPQDKVQTLFEKFSQVDNSNTRNTAAPVWGWPFASS